MRPRRQAIIIASIFLIPFLGYGQNIGFYLKNDRKKSTSKIELHSNLVVLNMKLNEKHNLRFILDTGVRSTILIDKHFTDSIGLNYLRQMDLFGAGDSRPVTALVVDGLSFSMNALESTEISALVLEEDFLHLEKFLGIKVDGIIGYDLFSRFAVHIDYQKQKLTLYPSGAAEIGKGYDTLQIDVIDSKPYLLADLGGNQEMRANLLIDTGASHALGLNPNSFSQDVIPDKVIYTNLGRGISGEVFGALGRISALEVGDYVIEDIVTSFIEEPVNAEQFIVNGSIGGQLLKKFAVVIDYHQGMMFIRPNSTFKDPFEYNMSGLELVAEGNKLDRIVIASLRKNSVAERSGFQVGDRLHSINNIFVENISLDKIHAILNSKQGERINLIVVRDNQFYSSSFVLESEI